MDNKILKKLFKLAEKSLEQNEFPVSAILFDENGIISCGYNKRNKSHKTTDHAEIIAIEKANKKLGTWNLQNKCMIVTLEPCDMCKSVIKEARLKNVYYIIPRYQYKKQYTRTDIKQIDYNTKEVEQYKTSIKHFFDDKR